MDNFKSNTTHTVTYKQQKWYEGAPKDISLIFKIRLPTHCYPNPTSQSFKSSKILHKIEIKFEALMYVQI